MSRLIGPINSGAAVGSNGSAVANADSPIRVCGKITGVFLRYNDSPPAGTTDVVVKTKGTSPAAPTYNILAVTDAATDGLFPVVIQAVDTAGATATGIFSPVLVDDYVNVSIAGANAGDSVDVWLFLDD